MNAWVLNNPLAQLHHNDLKAIAKAKKHATLEWDRLKGDLWSHLRFVSWHLLN